ncbi:MAG: TonB-dependent receptor [Caulobacteraceae bacterium]|nr:TonB-dependent receptor [Caulobacteraceae bacterium]
MTISQAHARGLRAKTILLGSAASLIIAGSAAAQTHSYDIPAQDAVTALQAFAKQSGKQVLFSYDAANGHQTPAIVGDQNDEAVLRKLAAAAGLTVASDDGRTVTLRAIPNGQRPGGPNDAGATTAVTEVVVTGSHIRGVPPTAPVQVVTRADIDVSGYSQVGDLVHSLPAVFGGGQNPTVQSTGTAGFGGENVTNATTVDLHGLGADATLTLLNGHRLAADGNVQAPDISGIPLAAVDHVDVVTDGASALYGSDAVAGVVNFVLRKNYDGAELSATAGGATRGGGFEQDYSVLAGKAWNTGHALASIEYFHQDAILASQRDFTSNPPLVNSLLWRAARESVFVDAEQAINNWVSVRVDGLYANHQAQSADQLSIGGTIYSQRVPTWSYQFDPSLIFTLPAGWTASIDGSLSKSHDLSEGAFSGFSYTDTFDNSVQSVDLNASGALFNAPSGAIRAAIGGGYRSESFFLGRSSQPSQNQSASRSIKYFYGELFAPLVAPSATRAGLKRLDLSVSARVESYSDVGSSANPKVGLRYEPFTGLTIRSTWGSSFKAPTFYQLSQPRNTFLYLASILGASGPGYALVDYGGNANLKPERAKSWTIGLDYSPPIRRSFDLSVTYFNVNYRDRIVYPISDAGEALSNPIFDPFIIRNASAAQVNAANAAAQTFFNETGGAYDPSQPISIVEDHYTNATAQTIHGVDLSAKDSIALPHGAVNLFANATWLKIAQQTLPGAPSVTLTGTIFNPPSFRLRTGASWVVAGLTATGVINYIPGETDNAVLPNKPVASWTTLDLNLAYSAQARSGPLSGLEVSLAITNLLDAAPPYARGAAIGTPGVYFDSTNTSPVGRFIALTVRKRL